MFRFLACSEIEMAYIGIDHVQAYRRALPRVQAYVTAHGLIFNKEVWRQDFFENFSQYAGAGQVIALTKDALITCPDVCTCQSAQPARSLPQATPAFGRRLGERQNRLGKVSDLY